MSSAKNFVTILFTISSPSLTDVKGRSNLPWSVICDIEDDPRGYPAAVEDRLWGSQYARCVFGECDNDVVDHQVVNMEFEGGTKGRTSSSSAPS